MCRGAFAEHMQGRVWRGRVGAGLGGEAAVTRPMGSIREDQKLTPTPTIGPFERSVVSPYSTPSKTVFADRRASR